MIQGIESRRDPHPHIAMCDEPRPLPPPPRAAHDVHAHMTRAATLAMAADEIARPGFPATPLPRVAPLPYVNVGHSVLFDYGLFSRIVWATALRLKRDYEAWDHDRVRRVIKTMAIVAVPAFFVGAVVESPGFGLLLAGLAGLVVRRCLSGTADLDAAAREYRKEVVEGLMRGDLPEGLDAPELQGEWIEWGNGRLDQGPAPVLIADGASRFPGYGSVRVTSTFLAPVDDSAEATDLDGEALDQVVAAGAAAAARAAGFDHVVVGNAVVVPAASLRFGSPWLRTSDAPPLWADPESVRSLSEDIARVYLAIQILFPEHDTAATLFLRTFKAGTAATVEIALCTLGPVAIDDLTSQLHALAPEEAVETPATATTQSPYGRRLASMHLWTDQHREKLSAVREPLSKLAVNDRDEKAEMEREARHLRSRLGQWPANWPGLIRWRERSSYALTPEYFGSTESRASIRALYERVVTGALDALSRSGFDISEYRDKEGRWHVHADKIESLIVGDRIFMGDGTKADARGASGPGSSAEPGPNAA